MQISNETFLYVSKRSIVTATYSHIILPTNGTQLWPTVGTEPINPSVIRRAVGRPKNTLNKANDEPRDKKLFP